MISMILNYLKRHKSLLYFICLNYLDKGLAFLLPIFILYFTKNISAYNDIEYIFSIANILVVLLDLGGKIYMMYGYSNQKDKNCFLQGVKGFYYIINTIYILIVFGIFITCQLTGFMKIIIFFISIRSLFLLFINYFSIYFRLIDKPQNIIYFSLIINLLTICVLIFCNKIISDTYFLYYFFSIQFLFVISLAFNGWKYLNKNMIKFSVNYLKNSLKFAWPIILNLLIVTMINNYGKIYIFNQFSEKQMFVFSYLLRISMIVQMVHSSIVAFYSKSIYLDKNNNINFKIYKLYTFCLIFSFLFCYIIIITMNSIKSLPNVPLNHLSIILLIYIFIWCQQSYFEQYLNKKNKNRWVLYISGIAMLFYAIMLFTNPFRFIITIDYIATCMLLSSIIALLGMLYCLNKLKLFRI